MAGMYIPYLRGYGFYKGSGFEFDVIQVNAFYWSLFFFLEGKNSIINI